MFVCKKMICLTDRVKVHRLGLKQKLGLFLRRKAQARGKAQRAAASTRVTLQALRRH
jgi:hypothetical protein